MSRFSVPSLARSGLQVLTSPRRFHAILDAEEGIARAVLYFFVCAVVASALDLLAVLGLQGSRTALGAIPITLVRLVLVTGLVPFIGGGILYGVCWIAGSKAIIENGLHVVAYAVGSVLPIAAVLRHQPSRGLEIAVAALGYGVLLVVVGAALSWRGRTGAGEEAGPVLGAEASGPRPQPTP